MYFLYLLVLVGCFESRILLEFLFSFSLQCVLFLVHIPRVPSLSLISKSYNPSSQFLIFFLLSLICGFDYLMYKTVRRGISW